MNYFFCPDFIWFKKYVLGTQGWSLVVKMDAFKCKSVADGWENGHLPFNLVQETAIDQCDQEALHWHINGQKSSSHCFQLLFRMHFLGVMAMGSLVMSHSAIAESDLCRPWDICHLPCISQIFVIKYNVHVMTFASDYKYLSWDEVRLLCISHKCLQWWITALHQANIVNEQLNTSVSDFHKAVMDNISLTQKFVKSVAPVAYFSIGKYRRSLHRFLLDVCGYISGVCTKQRYLFMVDSSMT